MLRGSGSDEKAIELYNPYLVNRGLSQHPDTLMVANDMNMYYDTPNRAQYEYLYHSVRRRNRYGKWAKATPYEDIQLISEHYGVGVKEARTYLKILTVNQLEYLRGLSNNGREEGDV